MTLLEAFLILQPLSEDETRNRTIEQAAEIVLTALKSTAASVSFQPEIKEDAIQTVVRRLIARGPRTKPDGSPRAGVPNAEPAVRAYLYVALRRNCLSRLPPPEVQSLDESGEAVAPEEPAWDEALAAYAAAERKVREDYRQRLIASRSAAVGELIQISAGAATVDTLIVGECGRVSDVDLTRHRNARYKRYERAIEDLHHEVDGDQALDAAGRKLHHQVIDDLRIRPGTSAGT